MNVVTVTGYTADGLPILEITEEYSQTLAALPEAKSKRGTVTAEELDARCTEAARRNGTSP